jgi:hypothetical protein
VPVALPAAGCREVFETSISCLHLTNELTHASARYLLTVLSSCPSVFWTAPPPKGKPRGPSAAGASHKAKKPQHCAFDYQVP